jgi:hypothetical protein
MSDILSDFIADARAVTIAEAAGRLGLKVLRGRTDHAQPCPACGGTDRFSFNPGKNVWNCRGAEGGHDAIGMAAHVLGLDLKRRDGFLAACEAALGEPLPDGGERENDEDRQAREARLAERRAKNAADEAKRDRAQADFREAERAKARGIYEHAALINQPPRGPQVRGYLMRRGAAVPFRESWLREGEVTYWHGADAGGRPLAIHTGPAMVAAFIAPVPAEGRGSDRSPSDVSDAPPEGQRAAASGAAREAWIIIGCHITWIDLQAPPKFRPQLFDPATGELLATKKMRGSKKGGLIPLAGSLRAERWVAGEGIENVLAVARAEGFRADSFYCAAGDLGNLAGPADPKSAFPHPVLTRTDARGAVRPVMVQGPVPKPCSAAEAMPVPDHVTELLLVADGDSERVMTAAAMARARNRNARPGRLVPIVWPKGSDFSELMASAGDSV